MTCYITQDYYSNNAPLPKKKCKVDTTGNSVWVSVSLTLICVCTVSWVMNARAAVCLSASSVSAGWVNAPSATSTLWAGICRQRSHDLLSSPGLVFRSEPNENNTVKRLVSKHRGNRTGRWTQPAGEDLAQWQRAAVADTSGDVGWPSLLTSASPLRRTAEWGRKPARTRTRR